MALLETTSVNRWAAAVRGADDAGEVVAGDLGLGAVDAEFASILGALASERFPQFDVEGNQRVGAIHPRVNRWRESLDDQPAPARVNHWREAV